AKESGAAEAAVPTQAGFGMNMRSANLILAAITLGIATFLIWGAWDFDPKASFFPDLLSGLLILLSLILIFVTATSGADSRMARVYPFADVPWFNLLVTMTALVACTISAGHLGLYESAFLFSSGIAWFLLARGEAGNSV